MCGIGGKTIEEAQNNISHEEFSRWVYYRRKRGTLNIGLRTEHSSALLACMLANRYRKEGSSALSIYDFAPHLDEPELTIEDMKKWE